MKRMGMGDGRETEAVTLAMQIESLTYGGSGGGR